MSTHIVILIHKQEVGDGERDRGWGRCRGGGGGGGGGCGAGAWYKGRHSRYIYRYYTLSHPHWEVERGRGGGEVERGGEERE